MKLDQITKQLIVEKHDAKALKLATVDIVRSTHESELRKVLEALAIAGSFDVDTSGCLL